MSTMNRVELLGRLGADPEVRQTRTGTPVCNFRMATNQVWTDKDGKKASRTEWHRIVVWGNLATNCGQYLFKGRQVHLEGRLQTRQWEDRDGNTRYTTEIHAEKVLFLDRGSQSRSQVNEQSVAENLPAADLLDPELTQEAAQVFGSEG